MLGVWETLYLGLFVFGAGFLLLQVVLGHFAHSDVHGDLDTDLSMDTDIDAGFDAHLDMDGHAPAHSHLGSHPGIDVSFLTPLVIAPTLAGAGAVGMLLAWFLGWSALLHVPLSILGGLALGYAIYFVLAKVFMPMQGSSEVRVAELWGTVARVTTPIPENRVGEIQFIASGSYISTPARSVTGEMIPRGQTVMIEKVVGSVAFVRPTS